MCLDHCSAIEESPAFRSHRIVGNTNKPRSLFDPPYLSATLISSPTREFHARPNTRCRERGAAMQRKSVSASMSILHRAQLSSRPSLGVASCLLSISADYSLARECRFGWASFLSSIRHRVENSCSDATACLLFSRARKSETRGSNG